MTQRRRVYHLMIGGNLRLISANVSTHLNIMAAEGVVFLEPHSGGKWRGWTRDYTVVELVPSPNEPDEAAPFDEEPIR